jgi:hypothetical protein
MSKHDARKKAERAGAPLEREKQARRNGVVVDVFGRRFTLEADGRRHLVDLGKHGAGLVIVEPGARLAVVGRLKGGEIKAETVAREGGLSFSLRKDKPPKAASGEAPSKTSVKEAKEAKEAAKSERGSGEAQAEQDEPKGEKPKSERVKSEKALAPPLKAEAAKVEAAKAAPTRKPAEEPPAGLSKGESAATP